MQEPREPVPSESAALLLTAVSLGVVHTALGPDHYVPFAAMGRAGGWSPRKTLLVTLLCGSAHVASSVLLGLLGVWLGWMLARLEWVESARGDLAGWLLIGFGLAYLSWGMVRAVRNRPHSHWHMHADGTVHCHEHVHEGEHLHVHQPPFAEEVGPQTAITPWVLFLVFAFGPCEPLIPLLIYPAAQANSVLVLGVVLAFWAATLATMLAGVAVLALGLRQVAAAGLERFSHALAGAAVLACGLLVKLGL